MTFIDFVGFFVALAAFFYVIWQNVKQVKRLRETPEEPESELDEQEEAIRNMLGSIGVDMAAITAGQEKRQPAPPPAATAESKLQEQIAQGLAVPPPKLLRKTIRQPYRAPKVERHTISAPERQPYAIRRTQPTRVHRALKKLGSLQDAVILREVIGPPKGIIQVGDVRR